MDSTSEEELLEISEDNMHHYILDNSEQFLRQLKLERKQIARRNLRASKQLTSAKRNSVRKPYTNLPDTLVALTTASKYFQMIPTPPGPLQSALRVCKSILTCSSNYLEWWRCIQDAIWSSIRIVKFWRGWDHCASLGETSRAAESSAKALWETWCHILTLVVLRVP
jgi:hypothetical protein